MPSLYTGVLVDKESGFPVPGATVTLLRVTSAASDLQTLPFAAPPQITTLPAGLPAYAMPYGMPVPIAIPVGMNGIEQVVATTTPNGIFVFSTDENQFNIMFSKDGYIPATVSSALVSNNPHLTIAIEQGSGQTLPEVVVTPEFKWILGVAALAAVVYYGTK